MTPNRGGELWVLKTLLMSIVRRTRGPGKGCAALHRAASEVLRTTQTYENFEMVVEWSHQKPAGNSGVFVWVTPESIQRLTQAGKPGFLMGSKCRFSTTLTPIVSRPVAERLTGRHQRRCVSCESEDDALSAGFPNGQRSFPRKHLAKGHGEWNHYYIRAINGEVRLWVNGEEVSGGTGCDPSTGYLCLESEGSPILFRKLRIRELP